MEEVEERKRMKRRKRRDEGGEEEGRGGIGKKGRVCVSRGNGKLIIREIKSENL